MKKSERTKQFIVEQVAPIFNIKGYAGTSLSDMTSATGLTKGSIYGNFSGKDDVALAAFDYNLAKLQHIISGEMSKQTDTRDKLLVYVTAYENYLRLPFPQGGCPILNTAIEADDTHPKLKQRAAKAIESWKAKIVDLVEAGIEEGAFKKTTDAEATALSIIALIEGSIMITKATGKINYKSAIMKTVENIINEL
ncbi:MAG: TetR/AcrR family transcriptional regulator [Bacteroidetes bacterium]|nr:TetR/AcrR family transcriptional regulator [Bacteroidota bacterium]